MPLFCFFSHRRGTLNHTDRPRLVFADRAMRSCPGKTNGTRTCLKELYTDGLMNISSDGCSHALNMFYQWTEASSIFKDRYLGECSLAGDSVDLDVHARRYFEGMDQWTLL